MSNPTTDLTYGTIRRKTIIDQLVHTAAVAGYTPEYLTQAGHESWMVLAMNAFLMNEQSIRDEVIADLTIVQAPHES